MRFIDIPWRGVSAPCRRNCGFDCGQSPCSGRISSQAPAPMLLPVFAGRRIVVKCDCDQRPDGRDTGDMEFMEQGVHNTRQY